jgi:hypothetical protein
MAAQFSLLTSCSECLNLDSDCTCSRAMTNKPGDVLIRHLNSMEYVLADAATREVLAGPFGTFPSALHAARRLAAGNSVWLEDVDNRGRPLGDPVRIPEA